MSGKNKAAVAAILESLHARRPNVLPPLLSASIITETEGGQEKRKRDSAGEGSGTEDAGTDAHFEYKNGDNVNMLFYKGSEDEEWYEGTVCRCEMRTLASG